VPWHQKERTWLLRIQLSRGLEKAKGGLVSSTSKAGSLRRFGEKAVEPHGLTWFNTQKEVKYAPENWIDEGHFELKFPAIRDKIH
ncbi:hypothetical protein HAX54_029466, partial [Datura stramonium]|nr:hypothetical protein [Datura stramonium]